MYSRVRSTGNLFGFVTCHLVASLSFRGCPENLWSGWKGPPFRLISISTRARESFSRTWSWGALATLTRFSARAILPRFSLNQAAILAPRGTGPKRGFSREREFFDKETPGVSATLPLWT